MSSNRTRKVLIPFVLLGVFATACSADRLPASPRADVAVETLESTEDGSVVPAAPTATTQPRTPVSFHPDGFTGIDGVPDVYDPFLAGESVPDGYRQVLNRDDIFPLYTPTFVQSGEVDWRVDELVLGVFLEGEARAYPVGMLTQREIVIDWHRGIPTMVTW